MIGCDLGSNTLRIVKIDCQSKARILAFERIVRTAKDLHITGRIGEQAKENIFNALHEASALFDFKNELDDSKIISKGSDKNKRTSINKIVFIQQVNKTIKEILGEGFSSHSFRQGLITEMGSKSINIKIISQFVGHKNISTTMGYIKPTDEQILNNLIR